MLTGGGLSKGSWKGPLLKCATIPNLKLANRRYEMAEQKKKWKTDLGLLFHFQREPRAEMRWPGRGENLNWIWNFVKLIKEMKVLWRLKKWKIIFKKKKNSKQTKLTAKHLVQGREKPTWIVSLQEKTWKIKIVLKLNLMNHFLSVFTVYIQGA